MLRFGVLAVELAGGSKGSGEDEEVQNGFTNVGVGRNGDGDGDLKIVVEIKDNEEKG